MNNIMLVGEAWSEDEVSSGQSFAGKAGWLLRQLLSQAGIELRDCAKTSVFKFDPGDFKNICGPKVEGIPTMPALVKGKYVNAKYAPELTRLYSEINDANPNLIVALGPAATWALIRTAGIKSVRGATIGTTVPALSRTFKVLPTYAMGTVNRDWHLRPIVIADLHKARRYADDPRIIRPSRRIWLEPTLEDLRVFERDYIEPAERLSIDIETKGDQVTCIGFAPSPHDAIVIPFWSYAQRDGNYWRSKSEELTAWGYVRRWCKIKPSVFQNGMYDINRLWRTYGITCDLAEHDTMLLHHALQPEMEKGLGFMATLYTDEASWKFMSKTDTLKKED